MSVQSSPTPNRWQTPPNPNRVVPFELGKEMMPDQLHGDKVKKHGFLQSLKNPLLPAVCPKSQPHTPTQFERRLPSAKKSLPRSVEWRNRPADVIPYSGLMLADGKKNFLMLTAGEIPLLLTAGDAVCELNSQVADPETRALQAIAEVDGYPDEQFLRVFGVPIMSDLLNKGMIRVAKSKLFAVEQVAPLPESEVVCSTDKLETEPAPVEPSKPVVTSKPKIDPMARALATQQMILNTLDAKDLANKINDDSTAAQFWLRKHFNITSESLVTTDVLTKVQQLVEAERAKYAIEGVTMEIEAWGLAIYREKWGMMMPTEAIRYSNKRTRLVARLYQQEADYWLRDLRNKANPEQTLQAGRYLEAKRQKFLSRSSNPNQSRRIH